MKEIRVHIDTMRYTRKGLDTLESIPVEAGEHNRVVLVRPNPLKPRTIGRGGFMLNSSFPTPAVLLLGLSVALDDLFEQFRNDESDEIYQVYGHADSTGQDEDNKRLSERRARSVAALLTGDVEAIQAIADEEGWSTLEHQLILRILRCDPGPIDGTAESLTQAAVELFQREYNAGVFHRHVDDARPQRELAVDGVIGAQTTGALIEALVWACSPRLPPERLHPTHPTIGCSEFNRVSTEADSPNRRAGLVVYSTLPPHYDRAPCVDGDAQACPLDGRDDQVRCLWYRHHIVDDRPKATADFHFDLRWLPLPNGNIMLSALTTALEGTPVRFRVWRSGPALGPEDLHEDNLETPLSDELEGVLVGGVAQVVWSPPDDFDLITLVAHSSAKGFAVPVFTLSAGGTTKLSPPPGEDLSRLRTDDVEGKAEEAFAVARDAFGGVYVVDTRHGIAEHSSHPLTSRETFVVTGTGAARRRLRVSSQE